MGIHIYLHLNCTLTPPHQRSASSLGICACVCVCVFWGKEVGTVGLSEGWFISPPLEIIVHLEPFPDRFAISCHFAFGHLAMLCPI